MKHWMPASSPSSIPWDYILAAHPHLFLPTGRSAVDIYSPVEQDHWPSAALRIEVMLHHLHLHLFRKNHQFGWYSWSLSYMDSTKYHWSISLKASTMVSLSRGSSLWASWTNDDLARVGAHWSSYILQILHHSTDGMWSHDFEFAWMNRHICNLDLFIISWQLGHSTDQHTQPDLWYYSSYACLGGRYVAASQLW